MDKSDREAYDILTCVADGESNATRFVGKLVQIVYVFGSVLVRIARESWKEWREGF
jgi:hypothetical protein